jgi:hypothetical protein
VPNQLQQYSKGWDVDKDECTAGRLVGHRAQNKKKPPFALVNGIEFVGGEARKC